MSTAHQSSFITHLAEPATQAEIADSVQQASASSTPIYPIGGGTTEGFGAVPKRPGWGLSLSQLNAVVDYAARDMTITVEAGITMQAIADVLAAERQRLPIDTADAESATLGGVIAANASGPRRYGFGTIRDYVIGISAVDGRGTAFKAGGRVVKNVAGYDFCKLLTGSLGTLAVITQVTLKLKPTPVADAFVTCTAAGYEQAERILAALNVSATTPTAIELLHKSPAFPPDPDVENGVRLIVGYEGTRPEINWTLGAIAAEWQTLDIDAPQTITDSDSTAAFWYNLTQSVASERHALVVTCNVRPSALCGFMQLIAKLVPGVAMQAHAGNGVVVVAIDEVPAMGAAKLVLQHIRPAAQVAGGSAVVWRSTSEELTHQAIWGPPQGDIAVMQAVKQQFDPNNILNPGRYFFA